MISDVLWTLGFRWNTKNGATFERLRCPVWASTPEGTTGCWDNEWMSAMGRWDFVAFLSEAYEKTSPKTGKKICSYRLIECHIVSCMFNIAPQPQRPPKLRPKLHMHCGISSFFGRFVGFHIRHHNPLMLVNDNSFLNASKMMECEKWETTPVHLCGTFVFSGSERYKWLIGIMVQRRHSGAWSSHTVDGNQKSGEKTSWGW